MTTISGGIFNFTNATYIAPTISGGVYNFTSEVVENNSFGILYQVYSDSTSLYTATSSGLGVYDILVDELYAYIDYTGGFTAVAGNNTTVYLGTTNSGVKYIDKASVSGTIGSPLDLSTYLGDLAIPNITSTQVSYMFAKDNRLMLCTNSGLDYFRFNTNPEIHSKTFVSGAEKCFITDKSLYYTVSGTNISGTNYSLNRVDTFLADWVEPTYSYVTGSGIFEAGLTLNDIFITTNTATRGGNTIFCATSSGIYVIDEDSGQYAIYYTHT